MRHSVFSWLIELWILGEFTKYFWISGKKRDQLIKCHLSFSWAGRIFCPFASFLPQNQWSGSCRGHRLLPFRRGELSHCHFAFFHINLARTGAKPGNVGQNLLAMILNLANEETPLTTQWLNSTFYQNSKAKCQISG